MPLISKLKATSLLVLNWALVFGALAGHPNSRKFKDAPEFSAAHERHHPSIDFKRFERQVREARADELPKIAKGEITEIKLFSLRDPERDGGSSSKIYTGLFRGKKVLIKQGLPGEARKSLLLSQLGVGVRFLGLYDFNRSPDYYVTEFIPNSFLLKSWRLDRRAADFAAKGFRISKATHDHLLEIVQILADLNIYPGDLQFLISPAGMAFVIDPERFRFQDIGLLETNPPEPAIGSMSASSYGQKVSRMLNSQIALYAQLVEQTSKHH